ncbi:MAG: recombinase RecT [Culicoidibacterales bacterium]
MATNDSLKQQLATQQQTQQAVAQKKPATIESLITKMLPEFGKALPAAITPERFTRIALTAVRTNPKLLECDQASLFAALMTSAQLGLEPNTPLAYAYLIPYGRNAQFIVGYKGIIELAHRSGQYTAIYSHEVYGNDEFHYQYGLNKDLVHVPAQQPQGEPIGYYAVYKLKSGGYDFVYWSREKVVAHKQQFSKARNSPWDSNFNEMAKKTVLKDVLKYAPKSTELARATSADEQEVTEVTTIDGEVINASFEVK